METTINCTQIQNDISEWHLKNYTKDNVESALLSLGEELGELMRVQLKQDGKIRGSFEFWEKEKAKEIGDVLITIINFNAKSDLPNIDLENIAYSTIYEKKHNQDSRITLLKAQAILGEISTQYLLQEIPYKLLMTSFVNEFVYYLTLYCLLNKLNWLEVLSDRWDTISKRDFITNPLTGGRENEV